MRGAQGGRGEIGIAGIAGPQGTTGSAGATGPQGEIGTTGPQGADGEKGATGPQGADGPPGPQGSVGADGSPGLTGATGPAGSSGISQYAYVYNLGAETVPIEAAVTFDKNGVLTSGIAHATGSAGIVLATAGDYIATFSVSGTEPSQMALFINGAPVPGAIYGSGAGTQQDTGQAIVTVGAGDVLTVRNYASSAAVGLTTPIGGTQATTNASIVIEKLG